MSFRRFLVPLLITAGVVAACSGGDGAVSTVSGGGRTNATSSSSSGGSSGLEPQPGGSTSSSSGAPEADIVTLTIGSDWCQKPYDQCLDAQSFTVDFSNATLTTTTCVELAGNPKEDAGVPRTQDAKTSKKLTSFQLDSIRKLVAALETGGGVSDAGGPNGTVHSLEVTSKSQGTKYFLTSDTVCSKRDDAVSILSGWTELWNSIRTM